MNRKLLGLVSCLLLAGFFATFHLTEAPKTWFDEGIFLQISRNAFKHHSPVLRESPELVVPAAKIATVGFPVIIPIATSFSVFGVGLLQARVVMVLFILGLTLAAFLFVYSVSGFRNAFLSTLLIVTHAPVYGNGKNVLGEVPGLFFFFAFLYFFNRLEKNGTKMSDWIWTGLFAGLFVVTKPNFLFLLPVLAVIAVVARKRIAWKWKPVISGIVAFLVPVVFYVLTQFGLTMSPTEIFGNYASMPGLQDVTGLTLPALIVKNLLLFVQQTTPAYLLITFFVWTVWIGVRVYRKTRIDLHEFAAYGMALLTIAYFLKMPGFFRYLFVAQIITFPYFVAASWELASTKKLRTFLIVGLSTPIVFQAYQVLFSSFVAGYYHNTRTHELTSYFDGLDPKTHVFFYHAPEAVTFFHGEKYSQYFELLYYKDAFGKDQLPKLEQGIPDLVIVSESETARAEPYLGRYEKRGTLDNGNYLIYGRK